MRSSQLVCAALILLSAVTAEAQDPAETSACLNCHGVEGTRPAKQAPDGISIYLGDWERTVHAGLECVDCHVDIEALPHDEGLAPVDCAMCHEEATALYETSAHGQRFAAGDSLAPSCYTCHDPHRVRGSEDPDCELHRTRVAELCIRCHADENGVGARATAVPHPAQSYVRGAHARAMLAGNETAATCGDCHDSHAVRRAQDPLSKVYLSNIPHTCGRCHVAELEAYHVSVHGVAAELGSSDSPVCNTCHGEHAVLDLAEPGQTTVVASETCESCHSSPALARRYDLPTGAVTSYEDSYHGRAARGGLSQAAGCTSCHGFHRVLAASDPASSIHPANLLDTCRRCHPRATREFAASYAHAPNGASAGDRGAAIVRNIYVWLIVVVIGGMLVHNAVLLSYDLRKRFAVHKRQATHERFNANERRQHLALLTTFFLLVLTGFALKYPDESWARALGAIGMDEGVRRILHRIAGVGMILASLYHLVYLATVRGREQLGHMLPRLDDAGQAMQNVAFHLGRSSTPPAFRRFRYIEKAEYWALVWGTIVMVVTGLILWFPDRLAGPAWMVRVAEAVHLYEAWLAFLAIVVWHLFFVMFRPGTFPVSFTFITGRMDPHELQHEHPEEYRRVYRTRLSRAAAETGTSTETIDGQGHSDKVTRGNPNGAPAGVGGSSATDGPEGTPS